MLMYSEKSDARFQFSYYAFYNIAAFCILELCKGGDLNVHNSGVIDAHIIYLIDYSYLCIL